ncbi:MAG: lipopolysaccharide kinase InaA family protein [Pseudomonas sp.]|uniref:lipopolysaccharide kinase InaA family protein n=1 Tax=Pseudomonas sp. TaxID=306 RepID=UPI003D124185
MNILTSRTAVQPYATHFDRWWNSSGVWVEPANQRRGGESGVQLLSHRDASHLPLYCKRQVGHLYRSILHPFGRPTVLRERDAYRAMAHLGVKTPNIVYCAARQQADQWQALLVTESLQNYLSLSQWYEAEHTPVLRLRVLTQVATMLARMHRAGWQHGCCYPKHIFIKLQPGDTGEPQIQVAVLDLEKSRRRWFCRNAARHDMSQLQRHRGSIPEEDIHLLMQAHGRAMREPVETLLP